MKRVWIPGAAVLAIAALPACPGPDNSCKLYQVPSGTNLQQPVTSLRNDVMPIFDQSCTFSSCHSSLNPAAGLNLGTDAGTVRTNLVGRPAQQDMPLMALVDAGDPEGSFLMHKLDGDFCAYPQCDGGFCGLSMPQGSPLLPVETRDVVRRWIAQGALDN